MFQFLLCFRFGSVDRCGAAAVLLPLLHTENWDCVETKPKNEKKKCSILHHVRLSVYFVSLGFFRVHAQFLCPPFWHFCNAMRVLHLALGLSKFIGRNNKTDYVEMHFDYATSELIFSLLPLLLRFSVIRPKLCSIESTNKLKSNRMKSICVRECGSERLR